MTTSKHDLFSGSCEYCNENRNYVKCRRLLASGMEISFQVWNTCFTRIHVYSRHLAKDIKMIFNGRSAKQ